MGNSILCHFFMLLFTHLPSLVLSHQSCGMYGSPPCQYLPAPPGQTPACAQPGQTYCEYIDNYPTYLIRHLLHKWGHEAKNLIVDETWENFEAVHCGSSTNSYVGNLNGYNYEYPTTATAAVTSQTAGDNSSPDNIYGNRMNTENRGGNSGKVTPNSPAIWFKRVVRDLEQKKFWFNNSSMMTSSASNGGINRNLNASQQRRYKRQSPGRLTLCPTANRFVAPQAALNSQGNWMFVVNEANTARQLVKTELCTTTSCDNLCQLPNGYYSRCEQKFVQKRVLALKGNGEKLYTDTFWFPSCCVCTISN